MKGRGIVLVAGNRDTFVRALTTVRLLRSLSCSLPAEVWHLNDEQPSKDMVRDLYKAGAVTRDLGDPQLIRPVIQRRNAEKQFQIKAAAIINSGFQEIIYLDSDNIPTQDPSFLFRTANYEATGALFWPDFWKTHGENKIFDILNIPCQDEWEQESGQMVIDKRRAWLPLQLAWFMQQHHEIYFQFLNGDKDTFKYAWKALGAPYHMVTPFLGMGGSMVNDIQGKPVEQPWQLIKRYTMSRANTWLMPQFYISDNGQACMDFIHPEGEPECVLEQFDQVVPGLQEAYFAFGGIGGETRS
ncbi:mannosyltransferase putative-domain-containing protein [Radiomyces spectabilis]|uniref:mannosyltransferase putative-domain-containing protein n=1 Tax=Radiomyces spectabilis TaxID=64574 RepID=UPI00221FBEC8|nr:mannosyltransferase putative-domain-containing protein [Radiomyces spectabilis]KAI8388684.1 mannosyltransferase putative-domain-containing protein [Radiomyces spectabilis]